VSAFKQAIGYVKEGIALCKELTPKQRTSFLVLGLDIFAIECDQHREAREFEKARWAQYKDRAAKIINDGGDYDDFADYFDSLTKAQEEEQKERDYPEGVGY